MSQASEPVSELPQEYPPPRHMLRDLGIRIERDAETICASLDVVPDSGLTAPFAESTGAHVAPSPIPGSPACA